MESVGAAPRRSGLTRPDRVSQPRLSPDTCSKILVIVPLECAPRWTVASLNACVAAYPFCSSRATLHHDPTEYELESDAVSTCVATP